MVGGRRLLGGGHQRAGGPVEVGVRRNIHLRAPCRARRRLAAPNLNFLERTPDASTAPRPRRMIAPGRGHTPDCGQASCVPPATTRVRRPGMVRVRGGAGPPGRLPWPVPRLARRWMRPSVSCTPTRTAGPLYRSPRRRHCWNGRAHGCGRWPTAGWTRRCGPSRSTRPRPGSARNGSPAPGPSRPASTATSTPSTRSLTTTRSSSPRSARAQTARSSSACSPPIDSAGSCSTA